MAPEFHVPGTAITIKDEDQRRGQLTALLMTPVEDNEGLSGPEAKSLAEKLKDKDSKIDPKLIDLVQEKEGFAHPAQAAEWLLDGNNLLKACLWKQDSRGGPARDYTV